MQRLAVLLEWRGRASIGDDGKNKRSRLDSNRTSSGPGVPIVAPQTPTAEDGTTDPDASPNADPDAEPDRGSGAELCGNPGLDPTGRESGRVER